MSGDDRKVAVVVRCHAAGEKLDSLLARLGGSPEYDLFVAADRINAPIEAGGPEVVYYSARDAEAQGLAPTDPMELVHFSDVAFKLLANQLPAYDLFVLVEYDVSLADEEPHAIEDMVRTLRSPAFRDVDLVGTRYEPSSPAWTHQANAARVFEDVRTIFYPLIALSRRAIDHLFETRLRIEAGRTAAERIHCEAFTASALLADGGFRVMDLNELVPGAYDWTTFYHGTPMLLGREPAVPAARVLHPVYDGPGFLEAHHRIAVHSGTLAQHRAALETELVPIRPDLLRAASERVLDEGRAAPVVLRAGGALSAAVRDTPVLLVDRSASRPRAASEAGLRQVGGRSVAAWAVSRLRSSRCAIFLAAGAAAEAAAEALDGTEAVLRLPPGTGPEIQDQLAEAFRRIGARRLFVAELEAVGDIDLGAVLEFHAAHRKLATAVVARPLSLALGLEGAVGAAMAAPPRYGQLWVPTGLFVLEPEIAERLLAVPEHGDFMEALTWGDQLRVFEHHGFWGSARTPLEAAVLDRLFATGVLVDAEAASPTGALAG